MADLFDSSVRNPLAEDAGRRSVDGVARAIYMTHWKPADPDSGRPGAPIWENVSDNVRRWVTAQAEAALAVPDLENLRAEAAFWRGEMVAKLQLLTRLHAVASDEDEQADIRANRILPILNAFRDANGKEWHARCEICGEFLRPDQPFSYIGYAEDEHERVHASCVHAVESESFLDPEPDEAAVIEAARALFEYAPEAA